MQAMRPWLFALLGAGVTAVGAAATAAQSGIDRQELDAAVRPQDDFYQYVNGRWLAATAIPPDRASYGPFEALQEQSLTEVRGIAESLQSAADPADPDQRKIADLYASFMDEAALERLGLKPLQDEFHRVDAVKSKAEVAALIAHFNRIDVAAPFTPYVHQDARDSSHYVFDLGQDGLGLPDRDYYLQNTAKFKQIRTAYQQHITRVLTLAGDRDSAAHARQIFALETSLARVQWTRVQNRDPVKTYNRVELTKLPSLAPGYAWQDYLTGAGLTGRVDYLVVSQPSYLRGFARLLGETPLPVWKTYFRWHLLQSFSPYLSRAFVDEHFAFYGKVLRGTEQDEPRWKRGVKLLDGAIGEGLGRLFVAKYFPPEAKERMDRLVKNLLAAYQADLASLDWMSPATRQKAQAKLAKFTTKIGYPVKWRDYGTLTIARGDLLGNVVRARTFEYERNLHKLGQPIDRTEWEMTPQTVNAYYEPERNEIVFPAAILRPPFFDANADDAANYGGIGAVIGHEISHGFDDEGSQYDGDGNLLDAPGWFTDADLSRFKERTQALVSQYSAYSPVPGYPINGELTLGENIADNSGLSIAYKAYKLSLNGAAPPVLDGFTGDQRFFIGWARVWRSKVRENQAILWIKSDPHSPDQFRGQLPEMNLAAFDAAFNVQPGDHMYLAPANRVTLW
jgi:predicted metalloendopeptidase